ncbi:MAG TPA: serine protease [Tepidisphaeraceae bacterium]|jgi:S1-C subfamily serine protease|nr:serine protease [Tepidisphaeraceae bacterium]
MNGVRASISVSIIVAAAALLSGCAEDHKTSIMEHPDLAVVWMASPVAASSPFHNGYGFFVSEDGLIVTSRHCLPEHGEILVKLRDGRVRHADFIEEDREADVAIIQVHGGKFPFLKFQDEDSQPGQHFRIIAGAEVIHGIFDHWEDFGKEMELNAGAATLDCGAPVLADNGEVIGVVRWSRPVQETDCLATPIWHIKRMMPRLGAAH